MSKAILIYPETGLNTSDNRMLPLSLLSIASPAVRQGFDVKIIDQRVNTNWRDELKQELRDSPLCVGVSSMTGPQIMNGLDASRIVNESSPSIPVIWGGVHPSLLPEQTLENELIDIVVMGDAEETFVELLQRLAANESLSGLPGVGYKIDGNIFLNERRDPPDLNNLTELEYDLIDVELYKSTPLGTERTSLATLTSRGCPFRCAYCYNKEFAERKWTSMTPENAVHRIADLRNRFQLDAIFLLDDNFFVDRHRVEGILNLLIEQNWDLRIYNANCRVDTLAKFDLDFLALLKKAGIDQILIGVESGSSRTLLEIKKDIKIEQVIEVNEKLKKVGIVPWFNFMMGFPGESVNDVKKTLRLSVDLLRQNPAAFVNEPAIFTPYPGTEMYHRCAEMGMTFPKDLVGWAQFHRSETTVPGFSKKELAFLEKAILFSSFLDIKLRRRMPTWKNSLLTFYSRLLRYRIRSRFYWFMPEITLLRWRSKRRPA